MEKPTQPLSREAMDAVLSDLDRHKAERRKRWRVIMLGLPALLIGLLGLVFALLAAIIGFVKLVPEALGEVCKRLALWMVGADAAADIDAPTPKRKPPAP